MNRLLPALIVAAWMAAFVGPGVARIRHTAHAGGDSGRTIVSYPGFYIQPAGAGYYLQPDGVSKYKIIQTTFE